MRVDLTGASRGIGRAVATRLAIPGTSMALCASAPSPELDSIVASCIAQGAEVEPLTGDLADRTVPARLIAAATSCFGGLDAVIANAGVVAPATLADLSDAAPGRFRSTDFTSVLAAFEPQLNDQIVVVRVGEGSQEVGVAFDEALSHQPLAAPPAIGADDPVAVLFTSGTESEGLDGSRMSR